jgi:hypothetical protein
MEWRAPAGSAQCQARVGSRCRRRMGFGRVWAVSGWERASAAVGWGAWRNCGAMCWRSGGGGTSGPGGGGARLGTCCAGGGVRRRRCGVALAAGGWWWYTEGARPWPPPRRRREAAGRQGIDGKLLGQRAPNVVASTPGARAAARAGGGGGGGAGYGLTQGAVSAPKNWQRGHGRAARTAEARAPAAAGERWREPGGGEARRRAAPRPRVAGGARPRRRAGGCASCCAAWCVLNSGRGAPAAPVARPRVDRARGARWGRGACLAWPRAIAWGPLP